MGADDKVKTLLFAYLFQVNDWFSILQQNDCHKTDATEGYLSKCITYRN